MIIISARRRILREGNVFTTVCHSVDRGGGSCVAGETAHCSERYESYSNAFLLFTFLPDVDAVCGKVKFSVICLPL